jgi:hypothetical protein
MKVRGTCRIGGVNAKEHAAEREIAHIKNRMFADNSSNFETNLSEK